MRYAEVIFEPGSKSVVSFEDEAELKGFLLEHNNRAKEGRPGAAQDQVERDDIDYSDPGMVHPSVAKERPAERVSKVYLYNNHPVDFKNDDLVGSDTIKQLVDGMADDSGNVNSHQLTQALRDEVSPVYPVDQGVHESIYKQSGTLLDLSFLEAGELDAE